MQICSEISLMIDKQGDRHGDTTMPSKENSLASMARTFRISAPPRINRTYESGHGFRSRPTVTAKVKISLFSVWDRYGHEETALVSKLIGKEIFLSLFGMREGREIKGGRSRSPPQSDLSHSAGGQKKHQDMLKVDKVKPKA